MYKTILVCIDNSDSSKAALIEAANWAKKHSSKIIMVHAVYFDTEEFGIAPAQLDKRLNQGESICTDMKKMILSEFRIDIDSILSEGEPPEVIVDSAREKNADLIMMGTHGRKGLNRLFMGSVTSQVIVNAPTDVLVVKKPCTECTGTYSSILLPYDGSDYSKSALKRACTLSKVDSAMVTVLYVIPRYEEMIGFFKTESIKSALHQEAQKILDSAQNIAKEEGVTIKTEIQEGHAAEKIIETARDLTNDLIVVGTYGWRGLNKAIMGSTTERVIMNAGCPVLAVR